MPASPTEMESVMKSLTRAAVAVALFAAPALAQDAPVPSDGSVLPFPPTPMAGVAAPRLQDSTMIWPERAATAAGGRAQHPDRAPRRYRLRRRRNLRRRGAHADAAEARRRRHQLQHVPHHLDLLADARLAAHRPRSHAGRQRHHRRARGGLGRLHRRHPEERRDDRRGAARTTATTPPPSASGTTRRRSRRRRSGRRTAGRTATASTISTASSAARPRSGSRG